MLEEFFRDIDEVCANHGVSIAHEDMHGQFVIEKYCQENMNWLKAAKIDPLVIDRYIEREDGYDHKLEELLIKHTAQLQKTSIDKGQRIGITRAMSKNSKLQAVKMIRETIDLGLYEAKQIVDAVFREYNKK